MTQPLLAGPELPGWQTPPPPIGALLDAPRPHAALFSPDRRFMVELTRPPMQRLVDRAGPLLHLAGFRVDPRTRGPARASHWRAIDIRPLGGENPRRVALPEDARIGHWRWCPDAPRAAFSLTTPEGLSLWVVDLETAIARRLTGPILNAAAGSPMVWLPADAGLLCVVVPEDLGPPPEPPAVPAGPRVEENHGPERPGRTWTGLLENPHDAALFVYYFTSSVIRVGLDGERAEVLGPGLLDGVAPSPDGRLFLARHFQLPLSTAVPAGRFAARIGVFDPSGSEVLRVADQPIADDVPIAFGSVRRGRRRVGWRPDQPATLAWVEALDDGDARREVERRDAHFQWAAPFDDAPTTLWRSALRSGGVAWGRDDLALAYEWWHDTRQVRAWRIDPSNPDAEPILIWDRNTQDRYRDPGTPLLRLGPYGRGVLRLDGDAVFLSGSGFSPAGVHPFLDRLDLSTAETTRLWQCADPWLERIVVLLDDGRFISARQSQDVPPHFLLHRSLPTGRDETLPTGDAKQALTQPVDWAPPFANVQKRVIRYTRDDGVTLSATLYLPPGFDPERDAPLPTLLWVYPREHKSADTAGQVLATEKSFSRPGGASVLYLLLAGYAILSGPTMPIVDAEEPNDQYVAHIVSSAQAAVQAVVDLGVTDPERVAIGGHSYGAFTAANLLAHTRLFRAGIARSGAYNRTLTPFGFQGEQRSFFEAPQVYLEMSPFTHAKKIEAPLLILHGADDTNSGTYPVQSERFFQALKGVGAKARWVELPLEEHGYRSREAVGHTLWEMVRWLDRHLKDG